MSDNKTPEPQPGEPVDEPIVVDNVVDRANEALASAQAARNDVVGATHDSADVPADSPAPAAPATDPAVAAEAPVSAEPAVAAASADNEPDWAALDAVMAEEAAKDASTLSAPAPVAADATEARPVAEPVPATAEPETKAAWYDSPEVTEATAKLPAEVQTVTELTPPVAEPDDDPVLTGTAPAQPIFVQAPEPPLVRGNRAAAGLIGLLAAVVFAAVYLVTRILVTGIDIASPDAWLDAATAEATSFAFWTPVVVFFFAFWLLGAFINRGRWAYWVIFGLLVGFAAFAGHVLGEVIAADPWQITWADAVALMREQAFTPAALVAFVIGRELPVWFGGWIAKRGRRVTEINAEAQAEYEATLQAGPQID